jgi:hypothetical protein
MTIWRPYKATRPNWLVDEVDSAWVPNVCDLEPNPIHTWRLSVCEKLRVSLIGKIRGRNFQMVKSKSEKTKSLTKKNTVLCIINTAKISCIHKDFKKVTKIKIIFWMQSPQGKHNLQLKAQLCELPVLK